MNSQQYGGPTGTTGNDEDKVDKTLRRIKPIERRPKEPSSGEDSLHTDSEEES